MTKRKEWITLITLAILLSVPCCFAGPIDVDKVLSQDAIKPRGTYYEATVPDTLDLAERAKLSVNNQTLNLESEQAYCVYQRFLFGNPPEMTGLTWNLPAKNARALPWLRTMSGSTQNMDIEYELMKTILEQIANDGLAYVPVDNDGAPKDTSYPYADGLIALAMMNWYERDGNPLWLDYAQLVCNGLSDIAIKVEDRAYYPPESGYKDGEWLWTMRGEAKIPYRPPEEPYMEQQGLEGCVKYEQSAPLRALVKCYERSGDEEVFDTARKVVRFCLKPGMWEDTDKQGYPGNEHGIFAGHFHGNTTSLHALLEFAIADDNAWLKQFCKEAYAHGRRTGVIRMGWLPGMLCPAAMTWEEYGRSPSIFLASETCGVSDMLLMAVKLTDAGLGDYWDDVDSIVRNHLVAQQITDLERMRELAGGAQHDPVLERFVGSFNQSMEGWINSTGPHAWGCCSSNGAIGLYYAWHGITRFEDGIATVNLFLNRASDWMDIDSYLPYEGKVVLHNKKAHTAMVRIPYWVSADRVECFVDQRQVDPAQVGQYLMFNSLTEATPDEKGSEIRLEFPISETVDTYTFANKEYQLTFRGSTVVDVQPRSEDPGHYQYYLREDMRKDKAPMHHVTRFVADKVLPLQ